MTLLIRCPLPPPTNTHTHAHAHARTVRALYLFIGHACACERLGGVRRINIIPMYAYLISFLSTCLSKVESAGLPFKLDQRG